MVGLNHNIVINRLKLLKSQIDDFDERIVSAISLTSAGLFPSFFVEYLGLIQSALGVTDNNDDLTNAIFDLQLRTPSIPHINSSDPMIQLKWLKEAIAQLKVIISTVPGFNTIEINLHPKVQESSEQLFNDGHYSQAIFESLKGLETYIREKSFISDKYGTNLMAFVFDENRPILEIKASHSLTAKEEQQGLKLILMGTILAIKDPKGHIAIKLDDRNRTLYYLSFISLLFELVDDCNKK